MARYSNCNDGHYVDIIDLENDLPADNRARIIREIVGSIEVNDFGSLAVDGTKMQAYASLYETKNKQGLKKSLKILARRFH